MDFFFTLAKIRKATSGLSLSHAAALALIIIQVGIGLLYKAAQTDGKYAFSASSSLTISELLKFFLSTFFFCREWHRRTTHVASSDVNIELGPGDLEEAKELTEINSDGSESLLNESEDGNSSYDVYEETNRPRAGFAGFIRACRDELPAETMIGFMHLALLYVLINNTVFVLFRLADPGTIQLIKSGTTVITALIMVSALGTTISKGQWIAILLQVCGIAVTQYRPGTGAVFPLTTYLLLFFQTIISSVAGVVNQKLCKSVDGSLHVMNMTLYASGAAVSLITHLIIRLVNPEEPGFFMGYGTWGAILVILSNVFIGLAMTAVYKYADALVKCFATAISTAVLLYLSPILFNVDFSFLIVPGTCVVFLATWIYMENAPPKTESMAMESAEIEGSRSSVSKVLHLISPQGSLGIMGFGMTTAVTLCVVTALAYWNIHMVGPMDPSSGSLSFADVPVGLEFESPFKNTIAFIRINHDWRERADMVTEAYAPFFHSVHISMPEEGINKTQTNITRDYWDDSFVPFPPVREIMNQILVDESLELVEGVLFYHFDVWIDPLGFADMDFKRIWVADAPQPSPFMCMKSIDRKADWMWFQEGRQEAVKQANRLVASWFTEYDVDVDEYCIAWSDIYYVPRRFFRDFIALSDVFEIAQTFHEIGLPTMLHIIDRTYSPHPLMSVVTHLSDCWGGCCSEGAWVDDILERRCGHKLNYLDWDVSSKHFERLEKQRLILGTQMPTMEIRHEDLVKVKKPYNTTLDNLPAMML